MSTESRKGTNRARFLEGESMHTQKLSITRTEFGAHAYQLITRKLSHSITQKFCRRPTSEVSWSRVSDRLPLNVLCCYTPEACKCSRPTTGVGNLRPAWTFYMARIRLCITHVRAQRHVKTKLHDKQVLR